MLAAAGPHLVDYDLVAGLEISPKHFNKIAVVQPSSDSHWMQSALA
jgi:hypothetical protein